MTSPVTETLEQWIGRNFAGHGRALRTLREPPIDGEPFMSMEDAKQLLRDGIAQFTAGHAQSSKEAREKEITRLATIAECAKIADDHFQSGYGVVKQIAASIRALSNTSTDRLLAACDCPKQCQGPKPGCEHYVSNSSPDRGGK